MVVETKYRGRGAEVAQSRLEVNGRQQADTVRQVMALAMLVQLSAAQAMNQNRLTVVPIISIDNRKATGDSRSGGVLVTDVHSIARILAAVPPLLTATDVHELATLLDGAIPPYDRRT